ncbi:hypothetical protein Q8A67_001542 [Cirrhinus molitorella]|uniref:Uncharacterized protein n=1 Tax=Cirrhinus molitorella TaxID=172907 RepID=A0AA88TYV7_9TELE|nr:hypothetical protein Q8A67_001542 [Cirrhinus molitorella]
MSSVSSSCNLRKIRRKTTPLNITEDPLTDIPLVFQCRMMKTSVNVTCAEIQISDGFEYRVNADRFTLLQQFGCEPLWFSQDNRLLADPATQKLMDPVISVSSDRLLTSRCVDELRHQIHCDTSAFTLDTIFRVRNETETNSVTPDLQDQLWWISVLIFIFLLVLICFLLRKRISSCFQFICQRKAPDNRDLEMLGSDHPRIGSVNQFSESVQCPDADRHLVV